MYMHIHKNICMYLSINILLTKILSSQEKATNYSDLKRESKTSKHLKYLKNKM